MKEEKRNKLLQILKENLGVTDLNYYKNIKRIERLSIKLKKHTQPKDKLLNLGSGAFLLECCLEDDGYTNLTAVDFDARLTPLFEHLNTKGLLRNTTYIKQEISGFKSLETYKFIVLYDCVYYPANNILEMLPQLKDLLVEDGFIFFDVYDKSTHKLVKPLYDRVRKKYKNRTMYDLNQLNSALNENGFDIIETSVEIGSKSAFQKFVLKSVYLLTGKALVVNYLVRPRNINEY